MVMVEIERVVWCGMCERVGLGCEHPTAVLYYTFRATCLLDCVLDCVLYSVLYSVLYRILHSYCYCSIVLFCSVLVL